MDDYELEKITLSVTACERNLQHFFKGSILSFSTEFLSELLMFFTFTFRQQIL